MYLSIVSILKFGKILQLWGLDAKPVKSYFVWQANSMRAVTTKAVRPKPPEQIEPADGEQNDKAIRILFFPVTVQELQKTQATNHVQDNI